MSCSKNRWSRSGLTWISPRVYPCLKGKAHNTRILLAWTHEQATEAAVRDGTEVSCMRAACTWALARFAYDLDRFPKQLQPYMATSLQQTGSHFLNTYMWLAKHCLRERKCYYALKPKLHLSAPQLWLVAASFEPVVTHARDKPCLDGTGPNPCLNTCWTLLPWTWKTQRRTGTMATRTSSGGSARSLAGIYVEYRRIHHRHYRAPQLALINKPTRPPVRCCPRPKDRMQLQYMYEIYNYIT